MVHDDGGKLQYSSSDNAGCFEPWNGKYEMNGEHWKQDEGEQQDSQLIFEGAHASGCPPHDQENLR